MIVTGLKLANLRAIKADRVPLPAGLQPHRRRQRSREDERSGCTEGLPLGGGETGERVAKTTPKHSLIGDIRIGADVTMR